MSIGLSIVNSLATRCSGHKGFRKSGLWVEMDYGGKGLKAQMKKAGRFGVRKVLIIGDDELASGKGVLRDMDTKDQEEVDLKNIKTDLVKWL